MYAIETFPITNCADYAVILRVWGTPDGPTAAAWRIVRSRTCVSSELTNKRRANARVSLNPYNWIRRRRG